MPDALSNPTSILNASHNDGESVQPTMSSREIADLCGKRHDNVVRDIRDILLQIHGEADLLKFEGVYQGGNGELRPCFHLPKRETLILVSGYSVELRTRIIDRWQALESERVRDPMAILDDPAAMRGLLLSYSEKVLALKLENAELTPKAEALDRIASADGLLTLTDAAKALQIRRKDLIDYLVTHGWTYRRAGCSWLLGYQTKVTSGLLGHKVTTVLRPDGTEKIVEQVLITPKGLIKLAALIKPAARKV